MPEAAQAPLKSSLGAPMRTQMRPRGSQECPRDAQKWPRSAPAAHQSDQDAPKTGQGAPQPLPKTGLASPQTYFQHDLRMPSALTSPNDAQNTLEMIFEAFAPYWAKAATCVSHRVLRGITGGSLQQPVFDARCATHARAAKKHLKSRRLDLKNRSPAFPGVAKTEPGATPNAIEMTKASKKHSRSVQ